MCVWESTGFGQWILSYGGPEYIGTAFGRVAEWLKAHAWKACGGHKPLAGSNPALSVKRVRQ